MVIHCDHYYQADSTDKDRHQDVGQIQRIVEISWQEDIFKHDEIGPHHLMKDSGLTFFLKLSILYMFFSIWLVDKMEGYYEGNKKQKRHDHNDDDFEC